MDFQIGDVVQLKSGGLPMTVARRDGDSVECLYFGELTDDVLRTTVPAACLERVELAEMEPEPPPRGPMRDRPRPHHR